LVRYARHEELILLSLRMQGSTDGISLDEIGREFGVSRRTAERMRDAVRRAFPQLEEFRDTDRRKRWRLPPTTAGRIVDPTLEDLSALRRAAELSQRSGDSNTEAALRILGERLRASMNSWLQRTQLDPDLSVLLGAEGVACRPGPREKIPEELLRKLRMAILAGNWISVDHRRRATGALSQDVKVGPLALLLGEGRQYLVAWSDWHLDVRLFALTGIERLELISGEPFVPPKYFDLTAYLQRSFGVFQEPVQDIVWRFRADAAAEAERYLFHPSQSMNRNPDGSLTVRFRAGGLREMAWHLFRWGAAVKVEAPEALQILYDEMLWAAQSG